MWVLDVYKRQPLIRSEEADEFAKRFDNFMYGLILAHIEQLPSFKYAKKQLCDIAVLLESKASIPQIKAKLPILEEIHTDAFWDTNDILLFEKAVSYTHLDVYKRQVLVFTKTGAGGTENVWFYDMKADGFSLDDKRSEIAENDIPDIIERFQNLEKEADRQRSEQSFFVPKQEIADNDYDLSINKYKKVEYVPVEYPSTTEIMADLHELEMEITAGLAELEEML